MALIYCKDCGAEANAKAVSCPYCRTRLGKSQQAFFGVIIKYTFILFQIVMVCWLLSGIQSSPFFGIARGDPTYEVAFDILDAVFFTLKFVVIWVAGTLILGLLNLVTRPQ